MNSECDELDDIVNDTFCSDDKINHIQEKLALRNNVLK